MTALEGVSVTAANAIRFVISAPSLLASRAAGIVGKSALRVAVRVGRATELRTSAVKRAVSGLPTPRLQRVSRSMRRLDDDVEEAITRGCGGGSLLADGDCFDAELVEYRLATGRDNGLELLEELPDQRALQLLDADPDVQDTVVRAWNGDPDVAASDVAKASRRLSQAEGDIEARLRRAIADGGANGVKVVGGLDDLTPLNRFLRETDPGDGTTMIRRFDDPETLEKFFEFDIGEAAGARQSFARFVADNEFSASRVEQFPRDLEVLVDAEVDGLADGPIKKIARAGQASDLDGATYEARSMAALVEERGEDALEAISVDLGPKGTLGEIDGDLSSGGIVESKSSDFGDLTANNPSFKDLRDQIVGIGDVRDLDGDEVLIISQRNPSNPTRLETLIEQRLLNDKGMDADVTFLEEPAVVPD